MAVVSGIVSQDAAALRPCDGREPVASGKGVEKVEIDVVFDHVRDDRVVGISDETLERALIGRRFLGRSFETYEREFRTGW